jgi:hypothetical protein
VAQDLGASAAFVRLFITAIIMRGVLPATNWFVGRILIRHTIGVEYGRTSCWFSVGAFS